MNEYRFVSFRQPASQITPPVTGGVSTLTIDFASSIPELREQMDGWEPVSFQVLPASGDDLLLVFLLRTSVDTDKLMNDG